MDSFAAVREQMVKRQLLSRGISDLKVLNAMKEVPRHLFVPKELQNQAYEDHPLPIGEDQTISQPYIVALMTEKALLNDSDVVLEVGTGSGYQAAVLSSLVKQVYTIERIESLTQQVKKMGLSNVTFKSGDGCLGWEEKGPFDAILVTAAARVIPESLKKQLKVGGRLVIPVGDSFSQDLVRLTKLSDTEFREEFLEPVRFVPLIS
jgi:protein-L-isoaspartate(D-aspartate) O-methyltransferase